MAVIRNSKKLLLNISRIEEEIKKLNEKKKTN